MTEPVQIPLRAAVGRNEEAAIRFALSRLEEALGESAGAPVRFSCEFGAAEADLIGAEAGSIVITSLLPEVDNFGEAWPSVENRLQEYYERLSAGEGANVFICTVLRHVPVGVSAEDALLRRIRVRRLNFLATELSRSTAAYVIDFDRCLADIGAKQLQTDYRLEGVFGQEAAGKFIALAILSAGLDAYVSFESQEVARNAITDAPVRTADASYSPAELLPSNLMALGSGRRRQVVKAIVDTNKEEHAGRLIEMVLGGQFGMQEAVAKLRGSVARRGLWPSVRMTIAALHHVVMRRAGIGR